MILSLDVRQAVSKRGIMGVHMSKATSSPHQHRPEPFRPIHLHEKLVLTIIGVIALAAFLFILMKFAEPSPPGSAVENGRSKDSITTQKAAVQVDSNAVSSIQLSTSGQTAVVSAGTSTAVPTTQSRASLNASEQGKASSLQSSDGATTGNGVIKKTLTTLQSAVNPLITLQ
jgi:hypothetical protein